MSTKPRRFFSADTLERARLEAAAHYRLRPEELAYTVRDKRYGFLKIRRRVVIEVDPEAPRRQRGESPPREAPPRELGPRDAGPAESAAAESEPRPTEPRPTEPQPTEPRPTEPQPTEPQPTEPGWAEPREPAAPPPRRPAEPARPAPRPPRAAGEGPVAGSGEEAFVHLPEAPRRRAEKLAPAAAGERVEAARRALGAIFGFLRVELAAELFEVEEGLEIELSGPDQEIVLDDDGEMLRAIQHLVPRLMRGFGVEPVAVRVDCDNFLEIRQEKLRHLAQSTAERVKRTGRPALLDPLSPADRRIVHLTLSPDAAVVTESQGEGLMKRIVIRPRSRARDGG